MLKKNLIQLFLLLFCSKLFAQVNGTFFTNYTTDQGLPSTEVYAVSEDTEGYLWFATDNGVCRFNGFEFKQFGPLQGLEDPVVFYIQVAEDGKVWFCSMSGKLFYYEKGVIFPYKYNEIITQYRKKSGLPTCFYVDKNEVYVSLSIMGILKVADNGNTEIMRKDNSQGVLYLDLGTNILNGNVQNGLFNHKAVTIIIRQNGREFDFENRINEKGSSVTKSLRLNNDTLLLQTDCQWFIFDGKELIWKKNIPETFTSIISIGKKFYACPRAAKGIWVFENLKDLKNMRYKVYLDGIQTSGVLQDKNGAFWITTIDKGVFYFTNFENKILDKKNGFSTDYVTTFTQKDKENTFVGLRNGDVFLYNFKKNTIQKIYNNTSQQKVYDLYYDKKANILWKGAAMQTEYLENGRWKMPKYMSSNAYKIRPINQGKELVGIYQNGFFKLNTVTKDTTFYTEYRNSTAKARTLAALEMPDKTLWLGNVNGLFQVIDNELITPKINHVAFRSRVEDLAFLRDSTMVIATKGSGILLWKRDKITTITAAEGLTTDMTENVFVDENDQIWVGTLNGMNRIWKGSNQIWQVQAITTTYGLPSNEINKIHTIDKQIWVATTKGLAILNYENLYYEGFSNLKIEELKVNDVLQNNLKNIQLHHNQNNIQIKFVDLNFRNTGNTLYRYRLKSSDDWAITKERVLNFSTLAPNVYTFEVQVKTAKGQWSESATQAFEIRLPWWNEPLFYIAIMSLLVSGIVFAFTTYIRRLNREVAVKKEIAQLQNTAMQAQMNPHFIFNCLNSIQLLIVLDKKTEAMDYLGTFSKLVRRVLQVSAKDKISLSEDIDLIESYLQLEKMRFKENFQYTIEKNNESEFDLIQIPPLLIQPYVENAIIHGIGKNNKQLNTIALTYILEAHHLQITIEDNGEGIFTSQKNKAKDEAHKSVGMTLSSRRLALLKKSQLDAEVNIDELRNESGAIEGTKVTVRIPV